MSLLAVLLPRRGGGKRAFTLLELLVVIAVLAILASMLLPALFNAKRAGSTTVCLNNLRQLQFGWSMYAHEHNDILPPNNIRQIEWSDGCPQGYSSISGTWVLGDAPTDRNDLGIRNGVLFPYVLHPGVYHCPADRSTVDGSRSLLRQRSYSASFYMNGNTNLYDPQVKSRQCDIGEPARTFVFLEEHENSIDDGVFFVHCPGDKGEQMEARLNPGNKFGGAHWMDLPADRHNQGCNLSFADGHARYLKWHWPKRLTVRGGGCDLANALDFADLRTLQSFIPDVGSDSLVAVATKP